jgi:hypothetical protein
MHAGGIQILSAKKKTESVPGLVEDTSRRPQVEPAVGTIYSMQYARHDHMTTSLQVRATEPQSTVDDTSRPPTILATYGSQKTRNYEGASCPYVCTAASRRRR